MTFRFYRLLLSLTPLFLLAQTAPAQAFKLFSGYDENPVNQTVLPLAARVNALADSQDFDQTINNGTVTTESFESQSTSKRINDLSLEISGVRSQFSYIKKSDNTPAAATVQKANGTTGMTNSGTFPTEGEKGISINSSNHFGISFTQPLAAFGFWGTDLGDNKNELTVEFYRDSNLVSYQKINYLEDNPGNSSVFFFGGLAETTAEQFNRVQLVSSINWTGDAIGLDQFTIATPEQVLGAAANKAAASSAAAATAVPTPALLPGLLGFALGVVRKRRDVAQ